ncbi:hypothetical protein KIPB_007245 [Kipferlia bialata]|uniref:Uncharacterized protein n=1 Tax=Kipferlia bialata TaxID=797122 RepID=A0A9K3GJV7_9EUKA|nr:hypothetical protein KIPB_007245 [Kipferlia bialata]|eukprot:g7245.t1
MSHPQICMIALGTVSVLYLLVVCVKASRQMQTPKTVDVFVLVTMLLDTLMLLAWTVNADLVKVGWCKVAFVVDYAGAIGAQLVMLCFAHLVYVTCHKSYKSIHRGGTARQLTRTPYLRYTLVVLVVVSALSLIVCLGGMVNYDMGTLAQCWFEYDANNYSLRWFILPQTIIALGTIVLLALGLIDMYRCVKGIPNTTMSADLWRYAALSFPVPMLKTVPTLANAFHDFMYHFTGMDIRSMWIVSALAPLCICIGYTVPRHILAKRDAQAAQRRTNPTQKHLSKRRMMVA